jgi:hypothetical protein
MNRKPFVTSWKAFVFAAIVGIAPGSPAGAQQLTGAIVYAATVNGSFLSDGWNTLGGDFPFNIYVQQGAGFINGPGNGSDARINFNLSAPGTYTFHLFGEHGGQIDHHALNLFFDGNDTTPRISAFAPTDTTGTTTAFTANGNPNSPSLNFLTSSPAANTLSFSEFGRTITLTAFRWSTPQVANQDIVSRYAISPSLQNDDTGTFTLTVTADATPEPGPLTLSGAAVLTVTGLLRRHRSRKG